MVARSASNQKKQQPESKRVHRLKDGLFVLFLLGTTLAAYWPALNGGFIWDDDDHISNNPTLRSMEGLWQIWFKPGATCQYYPLSFTVFWAAFHLWEFNTVGYHVLNVLLHVSVATIIWQVLKRLQVPGAWLAAAIFALHPVCVMSVAWMTELKNTLSAALGFGAIWAYVRFARLGVYQTGVTGSSRPEWKFYILSLTLFLLAMFAKTAVSFVPLSLLLVVWWQREKLRARDVWPLVPMLGIALLMGALTITVEHHTGATGKTYSLSLPERILISGRSFWFYLGKLFFPWRLTFFYERWLILTRAWWSYLFPAATLGLLTALWVLRERVGKGLFAAMMHFYVSTSMLILVVVLYMTRFTWVTDHWQYFGCVSVITLVAAGITRFLKAYGKKLPVLAPAVYGVLLLTLGVLTWQQSRMYAGLETLWRTTIANNPACPTAHNLLGAILLGQGHQAEAIEHFEKTLELQPDDTFAHNALGVALIQTGQPDQAILHFRKVVEVEPDEANARSNLANLLLQKGLIDEAIAQFQQLLELEPNNLNARRILGTTLLQKGRVDEAIAQLQRVVQMEPHNARNRNQLGGAFLREAKWDQAMQQYEASMQIGYNDASALNQLAWVFATCPEAQIRNGLKAVELAQRANALTENKNPWMLTTLAAAYAEAGLFPDAAATARQALQMAADTRISQPLADFLPRQITLYQSGSPFRDLSLTNRVQPSGKP